MSTRFYTPHQALLPYLFAYSLVDIPNATTNGQRTTLYPSSIISVNFDLAAPTIGEMANFSWGEAPASFVHGQPTTLQKICPIGRWKHLSIVFYCNGFYHLTGISPIDLTNTVVPLDALGSAWLELDDQIRNSRSADDYAKLIDTFLLKLLKQASSIHLGYVDWFLQLYQRSPSKLNVATAARELGLSEKHLHRTFLEVTGVAPKTFLNIRRFKRSLQMVRQRTDLSLTEIALQVGYFDQAHFIRHFKKYSGLTPGQFRKKEVEFSEKFNLERSW